MAISYCSCAMIERFFLNINGRVDLEGTKCVTLCCESLKTGVPAIVLDGDPDKTINAFIEFRAKLISESRKYALGVGAKKRQYTSLCAKCPNFQNGNWASDGLIHYVNLSMYPAPCQCRCIYCTVAKTGTYDKTAVSAGYKKALDALAYAQKNGLIAADAVWQVSSGEITIHPHKDRIMDLVQDHNAAFYTNCFLFDERIAQNLNTNPNSYINLSIDAGTPQTWFKVKGFDNFEAVTSNLVKYYGESARPGQITLKYIVLPGINDTLEDYLSLVEIMKVLKVPHLTLSRDTHKKYGHVDEAEHNALIGATGYLLAVCHKNGISNDFGTFTSVERQQIISFAEELLRTGEV